MLRYVSRAVLVGFTAGAGLYIIANQLPNAFGMSRAQLAPIPETWPWLPNVPRMLTQLAMSLGYFNVAGFAICAGTLVSVMLLRRLDRRIPAELLLVVVAAAGMALVGGDRLGVQIVGDINPIPSSLPPLSMPSLSLGDVRLYAGGAVAGAILGMTEAVAIAKALAARTGSRLDVNREMVGQGLANITGAFTSSVPVSGSFTRSAVNHQAGAETRLAACFSGVACGIIIVGLARWAAYIPIPALAGIIINAAISLIRPSQIKRLICATRRDGVVLIITALATLSIKLEYAIYLGVLLSIILMIRRASFLQLVEMVPTGQGRFRENPVDQDTGKTPGVLLSLEGTVFFGVADELEQHLRQVCANGARVMILRLKRAHGLDVTVVDRIKQMADQFRGQGVVLLVCGLRPEMAALFDRTGLDQVIGNENLFLSDQDVFGSVQRATERARQIVGNDTTELFRKDRGDEGARADGV